METFSFGLICTCNPQYGESREVVLVTDSITEIMKLSVVVNLRLG